MKTKIIILLCASLFMLSSCESFLDTEDYTIKNTGNFPQTVVDINDLLTGTYSAQLVNGTDAQFHPYIVSETASDERLGGCGENSPGVQSFDKLLSGDVNRFDNTWINHYAGIYRANNIIESIDKVKDFKNEEEKKKVLGEALFLRATFYWNLAYMFENVPLTLSTESKNLPQASVEELYSQIATDLTMAIDNLPSNKYSVNETGRATRWAAEGFLARVFLFYTGFYEKNDMPLNKGTLSKEKVTEYLNDCINNSGHGLVSDFRNLWPYSNKHTLKDWQWAQDNNLNWEGDENKEIIYAYKYAKIGSVNNTQAYRNNFVLWQGLPTKMTRKDAFPYGGGWATGSVCPNLWNEWKESEPNDLRREGTIIDLDNEIPSYREKGFDSWEETMYRQKKFMPIAAYNSKGVVQNSFGVIEWGVSNTIAGCNITDFPLMRFADILLMHSELTQTADGINLVRKRAKLSPISYSLEALQKERRWELSFEGVRWNDIRRWHLAEKLLDKQIGTTVYNRGKEGTIPASYNGNAGYSARYKITRGFWDIPQTQINLSGGVLKQNKGWEDASTFFYQVWH